MKYIHLRVPVSFFREGRRYVAFSPALDLSTSGKTLAEAERRFDEIARVFFEELEDLGTTTEVLEGLGWERVRKEWVAPAPVVHRVQDMRVPMAG